jgi:luciferase family oxidoreductase group 1
MLPNHAPLVIAEQFGTLEALFPGRIDLGLGRAPGGDRATAQALRRGLDSNGETFPRDVLELQAFFGPARPGQAVTAVPGAGLGVPIYLLGSSDFSARLAGELGLPFAFASHFAPGFLLPALALYREHFQPSEQLARPHAMVGVNVFVAPTDEEARTLFTSLQQAFLGIVRGERTPLLPPVESMDGRWSPFEATQAERMLQCSAIGSPETVRQQLAGLLAQTQADEIIATAQIYDFAARLRSFTLAAEVFRELGEGRTGAAA